MRQNKQLRLLVLLVAIALAGCAQPQTKTGQGALYGAAGGAVAGALLGQVIGGDTESTLIGTAIGTAVGGGAGAGVGMMMDNQEQDMRTALAASEAAAVHREGNLLAVSLKGDVSFATNSAQLQPGLFTEIKRIGNVLKQYPQTVIQVAGHTDSQGSETYNLELSQRRANAVKNLIVQEGVGAQRIETRAFGESMPVASNNSAAGRMKNRRVEIKIAPKS